MNGNIDIFELDRSEVYRSLSTIRQDGSHFQFLKFSPDGNLLTAGNGDETVIWKTASGRLLSQSDVPETLRKTAFSAFDQWLSTKFKNLNQQLSGPAFTDREEDSATSPDGKIIVTSAQKGITFINTSDRTLLVSLPHSETELPPSKGIDWSQDGRLVALGLEDGRVRLIDGRRGSLGRILATLQAPYPDRIHGVAFSADGSRLAASGSRGRCHLWDLRELERELIARKLHWEQQAEGVAVNASGGETVKWLAGIGALAAVLFGLFTLIYQRGLVHRFSIAADMAERHSRKLIETETQLAQSEKMKALGTLSAGVAHDFKNLLSVIRLASGLIRRDASDNEEILEETAAIANAVAQGDQVIKAMLGYSRSENDQNTSVDVSDVVEGTVSLLGQQFLSGIRLQLDIERNLPLVDIPQGALEQILLNLVVNASEAMGGKGNLAIMVGLSEGIGDGILILHADEAEYYVTIQVSDDGPGMNVQTLDRIFEPFFTTKKIGAEKGTGLGLATVYKIVRDNGLGLVVESNPEKGTVFELRLPVKEREEGRVRHSG